MTHIGFAREAFAAFRNNERKGPVHMPNLIRLKAQAIYPDGRECSGWEDYSAYGRDSEPVFSRVGGQIVWRGAAERLLIGPSGETWDYLFSSRSTQASRRSWR
jgi:hypothetical protein